MLKVTIHGEFSIERHANVWVYQENDCRYYRIESRETKEIWLVNGEEIRIQEVEKENG